MSIDPDSGIRKQDGSTVIKSIARNQIGRDIVWNWLRNSWNSVSAYYNPKTSKTIARVMKTVTSDFNTPLKLSELTSFYNTHNLELGNAKRNTFIAIQNVKGNVKWMKDNYQQISNWLETKVKMANKAI